MVPVLRHQNRQVLIDQTALLAGALEETFLVADIAAASATLTVSNINRFAINQVLIINPFSERAEFLKTHASSAPSGNTITLAANTTYAHYTGEKLYLLAFDQVQLLRASTATGTKTALTTSTNGLVSLEADNPLLVYAEPEYNSGFYFGRYVKSIGATFTADTNNTITSSAHGLVNGDTIMVISGTTLPAGLFNATVYYVISKTTNTFEVSTSNGGSAVDITDTGSGTHTWYRCSVFTDALAYGGWLRNTVGYMVERAARDIGINLSDVVTIQDCFEWINGCLKLIQGKLKRWPEHYSYNAVLGQASRGTNVLTMPTDAYDTETNKSIIGVRIGNNTNLRYLDPIEFDNQMQGVNVTQVTTQATSGGTTLEIDNSYDFEDSGTVHVYISGTQYSITYTGVTRSSTAGILTGIPASGTGSISVTIPVDTYVWQNEDEGIPTWFTVRNGNLEFYPLVDGTEDNTNIYGDYSKVATVVDSEGDTIDYQRYDMVQSFLTWRMKMKAKNNGELDKNDGYYSDFKEALNDAIRTLANNIKTRMSPMVNRMLKRPIRGASLQELNIDDQ